MNSVNYKIFVLELGLKFEIEQNDKQINDIFRKLVSIEDFDGVKKFTKSERGSFAKLTTSNDTLRLYVTKTDISLSLRNAKLTKDVSTKYSKMSQIMLEILRSVPEVEFDAARASQIAYSTSLSDAEYLKNELVNSKYQSNLDEFDIWLEDTGEYVDGVETILSTSASNQHSESMHETFEALRKSSLLENISVVSTALGLLEEVNKSTIQSFIKYAMSDKLLQTSLSKFGYGKK